MMLELVRLAFDNLLRARIRLIMTSGGVVIGTTAVIMLVAITFGLQRAAEAGVGANAALTELRVYPSYSPEGDSENIPQLNAETIQSFSQIAGVSGVIPLTYMQGSGELRAEEYRNYAPIMGIDPAALAYMGITAETGTLMLNPGQVIFGGAVDDYFSDPDATEWSPITIDLATTPVEMYVTDFSGSNSRRINMNISAVLAMGNPNFDSSILMPLADVIRLNEWVTGQRINPRDFVYDQVIIRTASREATNAVTDALRELGFNAEGMGDFVNQINSFFTTMRLTLGGVGSIALLVAAVGVANTMMMAILERTKEIGLMKAIGARDRDVLAVFLIEAGLVGFCGGVVGVGVSLLLQNLVNQTLQNSASTEGGVLFLPFDLSQIGDQLIIIPAELSLFAIGLATAVGLVAGLFPALRAARLQPVIALKQE